MHYSTRFLSIVVLIIQGFIIVSLWNDFQSDSAQRLNRLADELYGSRLSVIHTYEHVTQVVLQQLLSRKDVQQMLAAFSKTAPTIEPALQQSLATIIEDTYRVLKPHQICFLQLVSPSGHSIVRYTDAGLSLTNTDINQRELIRNVLTTQRMHHQFEVHDGRPSLRFVYPVVNNNRLFAIIEFGIDTSEPRSQLFENFGYHGEGVVRRIIRYSALEPFWQQQWATHHWLNEQFIFESPPDQTANWIQATDQALLHHLPLTRALRYGQRFSDYFCVRDLDCIAIVALPKFNEDGVAEAYMIAYFKDSSYGQRLKHDLIIGIVASLLLITITWIVKRWLYSQQRLRTITDYMAEGLYVIANNGRILYANRAAEQILGYTRDDLIGQNAHRLLHIHDPKQLLVNGICPLQSQALSDDTYRSDDECFRHYDGRILHVSVTASALRISEKIEGVVVLFRDISADYQTRIRLQQAETAFETLTESVIVTDAQATIGLVNRAFTLITGYSEQEVLGRNPRILSSGRHNRDFYAQLWQTLLTTGHWEGEIWNRHKNGHVFPAWLRIQAVFDSQQQVSSYVGVVQDLTVLHAKEDRLRQLSDYDQLTGLLNRDAIVTRLHEILTANQPVAVLRLDLDRFKRINDSLGHLVSDNLLKLVAERIKNVLYVRDSCARLGGDEFIILIAGLDTPDVPQRVAERILRTIRKPIALTDTEVRLTVSIGIACTPQHGHDVTTLLKNADAAMYAAKQQGRDRWCYFSADMLSDSQHLLSLEAQLHHALMMGELRLFYQPKITLADGSLLGFEALLRWQHPTQGLLGPGDFLDTIRDAGLMPQVTAWVINQAAQTCLQWQQAGLTVGRIACNIDALTCDALEIQNVLKHTLATTGIQAHDLELEIVETAMNPVAKSSQLWHALVAQGFELAIDDFGTGESSLGRLKQLPVTTLKIDRSFVRDIEQDANDRAIVQSIISMATILGKQVIAEGVETPAQLALLLTLGCHAIQGYLISRPLPEADVPTFITQQTPVNIEALCRGEKTT
jgi:diguanylate cyclase (GGDEF)-like protein/PAS domain S-box-containing protein